MGIFARAGAYLNLSPGERALLRFGEGLAVSAGISGLQAVMPLLSSGMSTAAIPWGSVAHTFAATVLGALGAAVVKFFKAQGDPQLGPPKPPAASPAAPPAPPAGPAAALPAAAAGASVPPIVGGLPA